MAKKQKSKSSKRFPVIGKYIDTATKAELKVVYFMDDIGRFKVSIEGFPNVARKGCRFQLQSSEVKRKSKFFKLLSSYLSFSASYKVMGQSGETQFLPVIFGLLKLRKGKTRKLVLIQSADQFYNSSVINIVAVELDNLLYLDLVEGLKNAP
jgi:hypothetical protein